MEAYRRHRAAAEVILVRGFAHRDPFSAVAALDPDRRLGVRHRIVRRCVPETAEPVHKCSLSHTATKKCISCTTSFRAIDRVLSFPVVGIARHAVFSEGCRDHLAARSARKAAGAPRRCIAPAAGSSHLLPSGNVSECGPATCPHVPELGNSGRSRVPAEAALTQSSRQRANRPLGCVLG